MTYYVVHIVQKTEFFLEFLHEYWEEKYETFTEF